MLNKLKKSLKKCVAMVLALNMCFFSATTISATTTTASDELVLANYQQYTISFTEKARTSDVSEDTISAAIEYVKSLNLSDLGYAHVEEACLLELESYRENDIILENYTVLVPKAKSRTYYGTYLGTDYYCDYTSVADMRREVEGSAKTAATEQLWNDWMSLNINLVLCFIDWRVTVPYTIISAVTGLESTSDVYYNSYNLYIEQFDNVQTRSIYKDGKTQPGYQDQSGDYRCTLYHCPVGIYDNDGTETADFIKIKEVFNGYKGSREDLTQEEILSMCNVFSNRKATAVFSLSTSKIREVWE